jgi:hypothetical protein
VTFEDEGTTIVRNVGYHTVTQHYMSQDVNHKFGSFKRCRFIIIIIIATTVWAAIAQSV